MVASSGSESVVSLLSGILDEEILIVIILESEFPSITDVETTGLLDLVFKSTKCSYFDVSELINTRSNLIEHSLELRFHECHLSSQFLDLKFVLADDGILSQYLLFQKSDVSLKNKHVFGNHFLVRDSAILQVCER